MKRKIIIVVLLPPLILHLTRCYSMQDISKEELLNEAEIDDIEVYTMNDSIYSFEKSNYHISNDTIYGNGFVKFSEDADFKDEVQDTIAMDNIQKIKSSQIDTLNTTLIIVGSLLFITLVVGIIMSIELSKLN